MASGKSNKDYPPVTPDNYKTRLPAGQLFDFVSAHTIFPYLVSSPIGQGYFNHYIQQVYEDNSLVFENTYTIRAGQSTSTTGEDIGFSTELKVGTIYLVRYTYDVANTVGNDNEFTNTDTYTFAVIENKLPFKKWTIKDVINRLLDVAEPIRKGESPRFTLNAEQPERFDKIIAPQFSFTKQTLRE